MLCERSYDPLSRMLLKGDEGGCKIRRGGWPKMAIFARGGHYPWMILALRVTGIVPLSGPVHSATHERAVTCWDSVRSPGVHDSKRDQPLLTPRGKIKNGRAHAVCRRARSPDPAHDTSPPIQPYLARAISSPALASPLGGAGSAMLFSLATAI